MKRLHNRIAASSFAIISLMVLLGLGIDLKAQILVTSGGAPVDPFDNQPLATSWAYKSLAGGAGAPESDATMDAFINGTTNAANTITTQTESNNGNPPGTSANARWSSTGFYLQTRPTVNAVTVLMATLRNDSGSVINSFHVNYDYEQKLNNTAIANEVVKGHRVYYSVSGNAGTWVPVGDFGNSFTTNVVQAIDITIDVSSNPWGPGNSMYLLFADDNSNPNADGANAIDNFGINNVTLGVNTCVAITNQSGSITVPERGAATFSIMATGSPQNIQWYRNGVEIPGATSPTYTIPSVVYPGDNGAQFRAIVSNVLCSATSVVATLTVTPDTTAPTVVSAIGAVALDTITISFSEPISVNFDPSNFTLYEAGTDYNGISPYNTYVVTLTNGTNVIINTDPRAPGVNYVVKVLDITDTAATANFISPNPTIAPLRSTLLLIGFDVENEWKYDINNGDRTGTGWETVGFDDSGWPSGPAGLGLDTSANGVPILTTLAYAANGVVTYFRKHFTFPASTNGAILRLRDVVEDGAVFYLNGKEIFRRRMPNGAVNFATLANGAAEPQLIDGPTVLSLTNLFPGDNVFAVEVHQSSATSTDVEMAAELTAEVGTLASGPPIIRTEPQSLTVNEGQSASFTVVAEGALPITYQWRKNGTDIPGAPDAATYAIAATVPGDAGNYTVFISNAQGNTNSATATLTVVPDTTAPRIISVVGETNLNVVTVTLNDAGTGIDLATAQDPSRYDIRLSAGGGVLTVTSAVATNVGTNVVVTLTTSTPRTQGQNYRLTINNVTDRSVAHNAVSPNTAPIAATVVLFPMTGVWRYDQSGTDLGTLWKETAFNDSLWASGPGVLGLETTSNTLFFLRQIAPPDGTNTVLSLSNAVPERVITYYFRTTANVPFNPAGATFQIKAYIDDGAILYINGTEQFRYNQTNGPGYTNLANAALTEPNPAPQTTYVVSNLTGFAQGNNVMAVEVHQDSLASSDVDWGMQLEALVTDFNATGGGSGPRLTITRNPSNGQMTISWTGGTGCVLQETTQLQTPSGNTVWLPSTVVNGVPFTPTGQMKFYRLQCP